MTQNPDIDAAKGRLRNAFTRSVWYDSDGLGEHLVRNRIVQAYALLGGDTDDLKEIREQQSDESTIQENTIGYVIPRQWDDAVHEYQNDPIARAIVGHLASQERARDSYWLWNNRGCSVEVPCSILGMNDNKTNTMKPLPDNMEDVDLGGSL